MKNILYNLKENFKRYDFKIATILLCLSPLISFWSIEMLQGGNIFKLNINAILANIFCYVFVYGILFALIKSTRYTTIIGNILFFIIGVSNHFVAEFRNTPILPSDLRSFKTAASVAGNFTYNFLDYKIIVPFIVLLLVLVISIFNKNYTWKNSLKRNLALVAVFLVVGTTSAVTVYKTDFLKNIGLTVNLWEQNVGYRENGFFASFINNSKFLIVEKPENYDPNTIGQTVLASSDSDKTMEVFSNNVTTQSKKPNIIAIMNESFGDPSVIADFKTNEDYMPFIRNMSENTIKGNMLVSVFGGNTCNSEFEFLTGNSMAFLPAGSIPYQQYVTKPMGNLTSILNEQGYESTAIHPYPGTGWNRNTVYKDFGFSEFYDSEDFVDPSYYRCYISDESSYDKIKEVLEDKSDDKPKFIFNVTIQNHGGYNFGEDVFESDVKITDMKNTNQANQFLRLAKRSDEAFKNLLTYLQGIDEPTIVVFFGDHMPPIEQKFYEEIYTRRGTSLFSLDNLEDLQTKFTVPFRIWANYDIEEQDLGTISANYLSSILLNTANLEMSDYNKFLLKLREEIPAMNVNGYIGADGKYYKYDEESPYSDDIKEYEKYQYNNLFDKSHKDEEKFNVSK